MVMVLGADVHKSTHTFVAVDEVGRKLGEKGDGRACRTFGRLTGHALTSPPDCKSVLQASDVG